MNLKEEMKTLKAISNIFVEVDTENLYKDHELKDVGDIAIMDPANICMIVSKSELGQYLIKRFVDKNKNDHIPNIDYNTKDDVVKAKYSMEYLNKINAIFACFENNNPTITVKKDSPLCIENKDIKIFLAPRVDND